MTENTSLLILWIWVGVTVVYALWFLYKTKDWR